MARTQIIDFHYASSIVTLVLARDPFPTSTQFTRDSNSWNRPEIPLDLSSLSWCYCSLPSIFFPPSIPLSHQGPGSWYGQDLTGSFPQPLSALSSYSIFILLCYPLTCRNTLPKNPQPLNFSKIQRWQQKPRNGIPIQQRRIDKNT